MIKRIISLFALLAAGTSLIGCGQGTVQPASATPTDVLPTESPTRAVTSAPVATLAPTTTPPPMPVRSDALPLLLGYVSPEWANDHTGDVLAGEIVFLDIARMRYDLNIAPITGADDRKAKLPLIAGVNLQNYGADYMDPNYFEQWGWDMADVDQHLLFPADGTLILLGHFDRPAIKDRLAAQGYQARPLGDFTLYTSNAPRANQIALKADTLIISPKTSIVESLVERRQAARLGLDQQIAIAAFLPYLDNAWGAVIAPRGDLAAYARQLEAWSKLSEASVPPMKQWLEARRDQTPEVAWDVMAVGWWGSKTTTDLTFLYYYPSTDDVRQDVALLKTALTESPTLLRRGRLWADRVTLKDVAAQGHILMAQATTNDKALIGTSIANYDWGFLPIRSVDKSTAAVAAAGSVVTSTLDSGWTLYTKEVDGFAIALPPDWFQFDFDPKTIDTTLQIVQKQNPELGKLLTEQARQAAASGFKLIAYDLSKGTSFTVNVSVGKVSMPYPYSLDTIASEVVAQFEKLATVAKPIKTEHVSLAAGDAQRIQLTQRVNVGGKTMTLTSTEYMLISGQSLYMVTLTAPADQFKAYDATFQRIVESFRLVK
jgi:hypothetical protein